MLEYYLLAYLIGVIAVAYATLKHYGLLVKSPETQLQEKKELAEQTMATLHGAKCPLCGGDSFVESLDMFGTNTAILRCEKCGQKALWKLERNIWRLIAPYRYTPQLITKIETSKPQREEEEEIKLVFG